VYIALSSRINIKLWNALALTNRWGKDNSYLKDYTTVDLFPSQQKKPGKIPGFS
jgi:hypothetical protein